MDPSVEDEFNPEEELIEVWPPEDEDPRDEQIVFVDLEGEQPEQEGSEQEQPDTPAPKKAKGLKRAGLAAAAAGLAVGAYAVELIPPQRGIDRFLAENGIALNSEGRGLIAIAESLELAKQEFIKELKEGRLDPEQLSALKLQHEWVEFAASRSGVEPVPFSEGRKFYQEFESAVSAEMDKLPKEDAETADPVTRFERLKKAYDAVQKGTQYNKEFPFMFDAFVPGEDGKTRTQCRSGTHALMTLARELLPDLGSGHTHVYVYTAGHILPGVLVKGTEESGPKVVAFESTKDGGKVEFDLENLPKGLTLRVTNSLADDLYHIMPPEYRPSHEQVVLFPSEALEPDANKLVGTKPVGGKSGAGSSSDSPAHEGTGSAFGFGKADVPSGDRTRGQEGELSASTYAQQGGVYPSLGGSSGRGNGAQAQQRPKSVVIEEVLKGSDLKQFRAYMSHTPNMIKFYNRHVDVVNDRGLSDIDKYRRLKSILNETIQYMNRNEVGILFDKVADIFEKNGLESLDLLNAKHPAYLYNKMSGSVRDAWARSRR